MVHLSGSNIAGDSRLNITHKTTFGQSLTNATNQKVGLELKDDDPDTIVEFPRVSHTFYPKFKLDKIKNDDTIFAVFVPYDGEQATVGNGNMTGISLETTEDVDAMYAKAIELGAADEGEPGQRVPTFYGAYVRDLDGNKLTFYKMG